MRHAVTCAITKKSYPASLGASTSTCPCEWVSGLLISAVSLLYFTLLYLGREGRRREHAVRLHDEVARRAEAAQKPGLRHQLAHACAVASVPVQMVTNGHEWSQAVASGQ